MSRAVTKACRGCGATIVWRIVDGKPQPFEASSLLTSHWPNCKGAYLYAPHRASQRYTEAEMSLRSLKPTDVLPAELNVWDEYGLDATLSYQLDCARQDVEASGVMACRSRPRDAQQGDKWCMSCFMARPPGYQCDAARFHPSLRYDIVKGRLQAVKASSKRLLRERLA